jgi:hypothetical protein
MELVREEAVRIHCVNHVICNLCIGHSNSAGPLQISTPKYVINLQLHTQVNQNSYTLRVEQCTLQYWQYCQPSSVAGSCELLLHKGLSVSGSAPLQCKHTDTNFNIFIHSSLPYLIFIMLYYKIRWLKHTFLLSIFSTCYIKNTGSSFQATQFRV